MTLSILSAELTEAVIHENLLHSGSSSSIWIRIKYRYSSLQCALPQWQGNSHAIEITQCYLPPGRGDIPTFTPAEAGTRFSDPGGMQGSGDLGTAVKMCSPRLHIAALKTKKNFCTSDHKKPWLRATSFNTHFIVRPDPSFFSVASKRGLVYDQAPMFFGSSWTHISLALGYFSISALTRSFGNGEICSTHTHMHSSGIASSVNTSSWLDHYAGSSNSTHCYSNLVLSSLAEAKVIISNHSAYSRWVAQ